AGQHQAFGRYVVGSGPADVDTVQAGHRHLFDALERHRQVIADARSLGAGIGAEGRDHGLFVRLDDIDARQGPEAEADTGDRCDRAGANALAIRAAEEVADLLLQAFQRGVQFRAFGPAGPTRTVAAAGGPARRRRLLVAVPLVLGRF